MKVSVSKWSIAILFVLALFSSCGSPQKENKDVLVEQLMDSLNVYKDRCDGEGVLQVLDSLKAMDVKIHDVSLFYAVAHAYNGDYDKGIQLLKDSISASEKPQLLYHEMGNILLGKGDTAQAIIAYKQAIDCNPSYARPYLAMAEVYKKQNEKGLAINHYLAAIRIFAEYEAYEDMGTYAAEALELDSTNIELEKFLQYYYMQKENHRMVVAIGLDIDDHCMAQNNPKEGYANQVFMGMSLYKLGDYENALSLLRAASEDETTFSEYGYLIFCYASASYRKMGDDKMADFCLEKAKEADKENAEAYINSLLTD